MHCLHIISYDDQVAKFQVCGCVPQVALNTAMAAALNSRCMLSLCDFWNLIIK
jgi:hypothetical protein